MNTKEAIDYIHKATGRKLFPSRLEWYSQRGFLAENKSEGTYTLAAVDDLVKYINALSIRATARYMSERLGITVTDKTVNDLYDGDLFHGRVPQDELGALEQNITQRENDMQGVSYHDACAVIASARQYHDTKEIAAAIGCHPSTIRKKKASNPNSRHKMEWPMYYKLREFADKHRYGRKD